MMQPATAALATMISRKGTYISHADEHADLVIDHDTAPALRGICVRVKRKRTQRFTSRMIRRAPMKRIMTFVGLGVLSLLVSLGQTTVAQEKMQAGHTDKTFVHKASGGGLAEVQLGQLATRQAASPDVKQFGQRMVDDHTKANKELASIARDKNMPITTELDPKHQAMADKLAKLQGEAFDREYLLGQVADHEETIALFMNQSKEGQDAELKAFASKTLPILQEHLQLVRALVAKHSGEQAQKQNSEGKRSP
jgi:putative membrane protein